MQKAGLRREDVYVDNVYQYVPPRRDIASVANDEIIQAINDLHNRIAKLDDPFVIVALGNYSCFALTGKGKVPPAIRNAFGGGTVIKATEAEQKAGITKLRGGTYFYGDRNGRCVKVIPSIHPSAIFQQIKWEKRCMRDWRIIAEESMSRYYKPVDRVHLINPQEADVVDFMQLVAQGKVDKIAIDIETWGNSLSCVGFAPSPYWSITVPFYTSRLRERYYGYIKTICESPIEKILQNGLFDAYWLHFYGINIVNWRHDTICKHHCLDPAEDHSLDFLASIYTRQNYWKDEAKDAEEIQKYAKNLDSLWAYNGLDCCLTYEINQRLDEELTKEGMVDFYFNHYQHLYNIVLSLMVHGVRINKDGQKKEHKRLKKVCEGLREQLAAAAGEDLFADKDFSRAKLMRFVYETLKLPKKIKTVKGKNGSHLTETLNETAILALLNKYPQKAAPLQGVLDFREHKKEMDIVKGTWDSDGRIRCSYKFTTKQGRFSSSKNPMRRGYNLQNIKRGPMRDTFVADEGCVFVRVDLSQVEDRMVKMYTRSPKMIELANLTPDIYDAHTENAKAIFGVEKPTKEQRNLGKKAVHAAERGMMGDKLSENLLKEGIVKTAKQCQAMLDIFHKKNPEIEERYFTWVRQEIINGGVLVNSWGRRLDYRGLRYDQDLYREGYSFYPQSENADLIAQFGLKKLGFWLISEKKRSRINLQVHDELIISCPLEEAFDVAAFLINSLEQPREIFGRVLRVPACVTIAASWYGGREWKRLPGREEFEAGVGEILTLK
jgi:uracil-DNA glycosylase family 4